MLDTSDPARARALERLRRERIGWLTTVSAEGQPQASPVWFLWEDGEILVYSRPTPPRMRNLRANPRVSFNLDSDRKGGHIVTLEGQAREVPGGPLAHEVPAYLDKYRDAIAAEGWTPEGMARDYCVQLRIRVTRVRAW